MTHILKLYHDELAPNAEVKPELEAQHSNIYVYKGSAVITGEVINTDSAVYRQDFASIKAGKDGAVLWRWELVPETDCLHLLRGEGVNSILRLSRRIKMFELVPTSKWLFRLDCIVDNQGSTGLHSHPGSGIRCMLRGQLRVVSEKGESSDNKQSGDCWYEEGSYPLVSTTDPGNKATFLRGMVMPPDYAKYPEMPTWIEGTKSCKSEWKGYVDTVITLR
jgi:hypothetical protein